MARFWEEISGQIVRLSKAESVDSVFEVLNDAAAYPQVHAYSQGSADGRDIAFFAGSGGDESLRDALREAGWRPVWSEASYWWAMVPPDGGQGLTYVEGDVYRGTHPAGQVPPSNPPPDLRPMLAETLRQERSWTP